MNLHLIQKRVLALKKAGIVTNGLVLNLDAGNPLSYPGTGTTWTDLSGNGNNGTLVNGPTFNIGNGGSIVFDGVNDYVNCGNDKSVRLIGNMSILAWIKVSNFSTFRGIISKTLMGNPAPYDYYLVSASGRPRLFRGNGNVGGNSDALISPSINIWQHISVTMSSSIVKHYLNSSENGTGSIITSISDQGTNLFVGTRNDFVTKYLGGVSIIQLYNRALSPSEILQNYNATKSRFGL